MFTFFLGACRHLPCFIRAMPSVYRCNSSLLFVFLLVAKGAYMSLFFAYKKYKKNVRHFRFRPHANPTKTAKTAMKNISSSTKMTHSPI
jgi:hypothetical protein